MAPPLIAQLAERRTALGLTLAELAGRTGLSEKSVRNALSGDGNPRLSSLLALADALGLELQLAPQGFGALADTADARYRPVATALDRALGRAP